MIVSWTGVWLRLQVARTNARGCRRRYWKTSRLSSRSSISSMRTPGVQERQLAQALRQDVVVELDVREDAGARLEADDRAALSVVSPTAPAARLRLTQAVLLLVRACRRGGSVRSRYSDRALTTETPTPCRPPETL